MIALLAGSCRGCGNHARVESYVSAPVTLEEVRARARPPEVTVEVKRVVESGGSGGGACGHAAVCLILLPLSLIPVLFPTRYDLATITEGGVETYSGVYEPGGDLTQATFREGGRIHHVRLLRLDRLRRKVAVETGSAPLAADGTWDAKALVPKTVQSQVDLLGAYEAALDASGSRALLLKEAMDALGEESLPLVRRRLADPKEDDAVRRGMLSEVCTVQYTSEDRLPLRRAVLEAVAPVAGPESGAEALRCLLGDTPDVDAARPFLRAVVGGVCSDASGDTLLRDLGHRSTCDVDREAGSTCARVGAAVAEQVRSCALPVRRVSLEAVLGLGLDGEDLNAALLSQDPVARRIAPALSGRDPKQRAAILGALRAGAGEPEVLASRLDVVAGELSASELEAVAASYARAATSDTARGPLVDLLAAARAKGPRGQAARAAIQGALSAAARQERPRFEAALVVLGERDRALQAARGLKVRDRSFLEAVAGTLDQSDVVARALTLAGCSEEALGRAREAGARAGDDERGALCVG